MKSTVDARTTGEAQGNAAAPVAKAPRFSSPEDEVAYFETHSTVEDPDSFETLAPDAIRVRGKRRTRQLISLRVFPHQLERFKRVAARQGMPYQTLIQLWLAQKLAEEDSGGAG
jgi:predicted DNA binding CopG/RHH family protein